MKAWRVSAGVVFGALGLWGYSTGPDAHASLGPGDSAFFPKGCASAGCHTSSGSGGPINNFAGFGVTATFSSGTTYTPGGAPINVTVSVTDPNNSKFGFQMSARLNSNPNTGQAGTFTPGANQIVLCDDDTNRPKSGCSAAHPVEFIEHSFATPQQVQTTPYTFTWTPPATNVGAVTFYFAGNAVNGNGASDGGDHVYTGSVTLNPATASAPPPSIGSAISAGAYGAIASFASGSWLEIYGSNLASPVCTPACSYRSWAGSDFNGSNAPTKLDGTSVTINNKPAYVAFISAGQVNVQAPADTATGTVQVTLTSPSNQTSTFMMQRAATASGLLAPPSFKVNGKQYIASTLPDYVTYLGDPTVVPGTSRPAKPGETILFYGIGFGDSKDSSGNTIQPGVTVSALNSLASPVTIKFGSTAATVAYQGLLPGYVGLYQFNVVVPSSITTAGDQQIVVTQNGQNLSQTLYLAVKP